jgi:membrane-associated protease RseP (regulator of RpoE activity)
MRPSGFPSLEHTPNGWGRSVLAGRRRPNYHTHIVLFLMTVVTTMVAGMWWENLHPLQQIEEFYRGLPYAFTLLAILFCHEMGHYLTARYYGIDVTLPYFIPMPPPLFPIGTLGAFIRMKSLPHNRRALLNVGAAGPIAGFCIALPAAIYAYTTATVIPMPSSGGLSFAEPLLLQMINRVVLGPLPPGSVIQISSVGIAAWFGLLVTMLNLLPVGQLDGGHIVYALLGRRARYLSWTVVAALLIMGVVFNTMWFMWAGIGIVLLRLRPPVILDQHTPLDWRSYLIAALSLIIFVLCFMPSPISLSGMEG